MLGDPVGASVGASVGDPTGASVGGRGRELLGAEVGRSVGVASPSTPITNVASTALRQPIENFMMTRQRGSVVCFTISDKRSFRAYT